MALTDFAIRAAKAKDKPYKLGDTLGLFLLVQPKGGKLWRLKYRVDGKEQKLGLGTYPEVSLSEARKRRDEARQQLAAGKNPAFEKRRDKLRASQQSENTFTALSKEYCERRKRDGVRPWAPATAERSEYLLSLLDDTIGRMPIAEIEPVDVLAAIRKIEARGTMESARRTLQLAGAVFRYGLATARLRSDPTRDLKGALITPRAKNYSAITDASRVGELLRAIDDYQG